MQGETEPEILAHAGHHWSPGRAATLAFLAAYVVFVLRRPDILLHAQMWAEDGAIWFSEIYNNGLLDTVIRPHAGYFQTFSKLVFAALIPVPLEYVPAIANAVGVAVRAWCVAILFTGRLDPLDPRVRFLLAIFLVLQPGLEEVHANITNTHWYLLLLALTVMVANRPAGLAWKTHDVAILALAGLSGPFCILLLPALAVRLIGKPVTSAVRQVRAWLLDPRVIVLAATSFIQVSIMATHGASGRSQAPLGASTELFGQILATRVFAGFLLPAAYKTALWHHAGLCLAISMAGLAVLAYVIVRGSDRLKNITVFSALMMVPMLLSPQILLEGEQWPTLAEPMVGQRYFIIAPVAWLAILIWIATQHMRRHATVLAALALTAILASGIDRFRLTPLPDSGYYEAVARIGETTSGKVTIPIAPPGWQMVLDLDAR